MEVIFAPGLAKLKGFPLNLWAERRGPAPPIPLWAAPFGVRAAQRGIGGGPNEVVVGMSQGGTTPVSLPRL